MRRFTMYVARGSGKGTNVRQKAMAMCLFVRDSRALACIERRLGDRDPNLAGLFEVFTQLITDEQTPSQERLSPAHDNRSSVAC